MNRGIPREFYIVKLILNSTSVDGFPHACYCYLKQILILRLNGNVACKLEASSNNGGMKTFVQFPKKVLHQIYKQFNRNRETDMLFYIYLYI